MTLPVTIPNTFANATTSIPLANLDANFVAIYDAVNGIGNGAESLANVSITGGTVTNVAVSATTLNTSGQVVFNDAGANVDFRVEGDTKPNLLFVDASADAVAMGTDTPLSTEAGLDISSGGLSLVVGANNTSTARTDATNKISRIASAHYTNAEEPVMLAFTENTSTTNEITFGGGSGITNAATLIAFRTAANNTTTSGTERMRITSAGEVLVGGTTSVDANSGILTLQRLSTSPVVYLFRDDTSIGSGNILGGVSFVGNDTTSNTPTTHAYIYGVASGTHAAGDNPTDLTFGTTPDGSATVAEVARFTESKYLRFASGTGGIQFNGDTAAANALDDYEEGTWTPTYIPDGGAFTSITYDASTAGRYTKIGNTVYIQGSIRTDAITVGTATGTVYVGGLPFTVNASIPYASAIVAYAIDFVGDMPSGALFDINTTTIILYYRTTANGVSTPLNVGDLGTTTNDNYCIFSGFYTVA